MRTRAAFLLVALGLPTPATSGARGAAEQTPSLSLVEAAPVGESEALQLDGQLLEPIWHSTLPVSEFRQREPEDGAPATYPTEVRVAWSNTAIFVAVRALDPKPDKIVGILTRRDADSPSDWIRVLIDSYHDRRTAYEFAVNPVGVKQDSYRFNDQDEDRGWDAVWDVAVARDAEGWSAEFRIPISQLRFDPKNGGTLGFAVVRQIGRLNETATWPLLSKSANGYVSSFGELQGVGRPQAPRRFELVPYTLGQLTTEPPEPDNPLADSRDAQVLGGADLKVRLSPALTLTSTLNPDFGQVEADPAVVNLTAFETFFTERRPFFMEGSGIFRFDVNCNDGECTGLFYSRRIGRPPQGSPDLPEGGYSRAPGQTTILGASKLTGRTSGFSIGFLNALTSEETAQVASGRERYREVVEPFTSYSVARVRREFANQSSLGFMLTGTQRKLADSVRFLPEQAYTGGIDWDWRLGTERTYSLTGYWAASHLRGDPGAIERLQTNSVHYFQRPDADHLEFDPRRTTLNGQAGYVAFNKVGGERLRFAFNLALKSPGFEINDLGFLPRADQITSSSWVQLRRDRPGRLVRSFRINFNQWSGWNFGGDRLFRGGNVNLHWVFTNNWRTGAGLNLNQNGLDDRASRGGPLLRDNGKLGVWNYLNSDDRRSVHFGWGTFYLNDRRGTEIWDFHPNVTFRPTPALSVQLGIRYFLNRNDYQWVENIDGPPDHYVFAHLEQRTVSITTRFNYTITPTLSIQVYAQPFVSAGAYRDFRELAAGTASRYEDRFAPFAYEGNPDFNFKSFRTTNVLRWEYRPGSALFVVWQQARKEVGDFGELRAGRDFGDLFAIPATNAFLVKLSHWLNF
jgi:hypothetical protein